LTGPTPTKIRSYLPNFTARTVRAVPAGPPAQVPHSLVAGETRYLALAVVGVRSAAPRLKRYANE
jgi:hypothetical protein